MLKFLRSKKGFTLVELMVVCIIVAILAAVAIPLMGANKRRAYATEATSTIGMIRSAVRTYYAEHNSYPASIGSTGWDGSEAALGITATDLLGNFFSATNFVYTAPTSGDNYTIVCTWNATNTAPRAADVATANTTTFTGSTGLFTGTY